jgi:hypothetical protein
MVTQAIVCINLFMLPIFLISDRTNQTRNAKREKQNMQFLILFIFKQFCNQNEKTNQAHN